MVTCSAGSPVSAVSGRCVYAGVVEHSVYVHPGARGQGVGRQLLDALIGSTEAAGIWTIECGIFPENTASAALHQAAGFRTVGDPRTDRPASWPLARRGPDRAAQRRRLTYGRSHGLRMAEDGTGAG